MIFHHLPYWENAAVADVRMRDSRSLPGRGRTVGLGIFSAIVLHGTMARAQPVSTFASMPILSAKDLSFSATSQPDGVKGEVIHVQGRKSIMRPALKEPLMRQFPDGHTERDVQVWPRVRVHVQLGADIDHDPVTGANLKAFGEAYESSSPLVRH